MVDNYSLWEAHDSEQERRLARRPKCSVCGEYIQDESAVHIGNYWICDDCIENNREYIEEE